MGMLAFDFRSHLRQRGPTPANRAVAGGAWPHAARIVFTLALSASTVGDSSMKYRVDHGGK
jgi:hypothetical protein